MTERQIREACDVLNRHQHLGRDDWMLFAGEVRSWKVGKWRRLQRTVEEALILARHYESQTPGGAALHSEERPTYGGSIAASR